MIGLTTNPKRDSNIIIFVRGVAYLKLNVRMCTYVVNVFMQMLLK